MKKLLLISILTLIGITSQSQILITLLLGDKLNQPGLEFGLEGGANWSQISGLENENFLTTFNMGFYFDIRLKNQLSLYTGVLVKANLGSDKITDNDLIKMDAEFYKDQTGTRLVGDYRHRMSYFLVPILFKYKFKNQIHIAAGPQLGLMYKSWIEFNSDIDGKDATIKDYNREDINKLDAGIAVGLGYRLFKGTGWTISAKYYYGFVDVYKNISGTKNSSIFMEVCIPVGAGKKPSKDKK
ncbi:MAG: PorT family protein [Bacteroidales bacterium]|nr:PorT family protein [Bacteroidales bacterium]